MTFKVIYEIIQSEFPQYRLALIKNDINTGYKDFCSRTGLPRSSYNVAITSATSYTLHSDVDKVYEVEVLDANSKKIDDISYQIDNGIIYFYDTFGGELTAMDDDVYSITIYYHAIPTAMTSDTEEPDLPTQFHYALIEYVFSKYYRRKQDFNNAKFSATTYEQLVREGKQAANINQCTVHTVDVDTLFDSEWMISGAGNYGTVINGSNTRIPNGTTAERPTLTTDDVGYVYFDTTLNSPIWWNGTAWV